MTNLELIQDLIKQAKEIEYRNDKKDAVIKRAEMLIRKIFDNESHYLKSLKDISYSPSMFFANSPNSLFENHFNSGKKELLNLLTVIEEDIKIDSEINSQKKTNKNSTSTSKNVFIVHGHNEEMKHSVARVLDKLKLNPIILHEQPSKGKTIIDKLGVNSDVIYAIVLLSADDIAYNKTSEPETAKFRARQNVIFELGYFIGKLGQEKVIALHEIGSELEIPSDYTGVLFVPFDKQGKWQFDIVRELKSIGINVDANDII